MIERRGRGTERSGVYEYGCQKPTNKTKQKLRGKNEKRENLEYHTRSTVSYQVQICSSNHFYDKSSKNLVISAQANSLV